MEDSSKSSSALRTGAEPKKHAHFSHEAEEVPLLTGGASLLLDSGACGEADAEEGVASPHRVKFGRAKTITIGELHKKTWRVEDSLSSMSSFAFIVNMFADLCPAGILPLAAGLKKTGYAPAFLILGVLYLICVYTMWCISRVCEITGQHTFRSQWEKAIGRRSSGIPVCVIILVTFGCCLAYSCFFADIFKGVLLWERSSCLWLFTLCPLMPLCLLKDLSALAYSSFVALIMVIFSVVMMCLRATDGTYAQGGAFFGHIPKEGLPEIPKHHLVDIGLNSLVLVNFLAMAFCSHYNGCKYYRELRNHTPSNFRQCTGVAMGITAALYAVGMVAGFQTFGTHARGVILENYAPDDTLANIARVGMGFSIIAAFPLMFCGLREATIELLVMAQPSLEDGLAGVCAQNLLSCFMVLLVTLCAWVLTDAGLVVGVVGAVCGSAVIYVMPCVLYAASLQQFLDCSRRELAMEVAIAKTVATCGVLLGVGGLYASLAL